MRLDIGWNDLGAGLIACLLPARRSRLARSTSRAWSADESALVTLSVRSGFDLLLRALQLPQGSEVLFSALTVPDMAQIAEAHGLVPVPVEIDRSGNLDLKSLRQVITPRSRILVVAHLFGGTAKLDEVCAIAKSADLMVVEDCAQSFTRVGDHGHASADVTLFSFGPIKSATALGGATIVLESDALRVRMKAILNDDPVQTRTSFARRLAWFSLLKLLSGKRMSAAFRKVLEHLAIDFDRFASSAARGFRGTDLLEQLRRQPSVPLLRLMKRRWRSYRFDRISRRRSLGERLDDHLGLSRPKTHSYWIYPYYSDSPLRLCTSLQKAGFDATCRSRMAVVSDHSSFKAMKIHANWQQVVFLPWYPDLTRAAVDKMAEIIAKEAASPAP